jgi:two-component system, sensor histidine kinase
MPDPSQLQTSPVAPPSADILVVDDNEGNLLAIEAALGELSRRLVKARSGAEALRYLLEQDFALILLDVEMPGLSGYETARLIRSRQRSMRVPIIFITAYSRDDEEVLEGYALGAVDFLFKPIVPEVLRAKASVFVELQQRTLEVSRQAELLREAQRREHERRMAEAEQRWEAEWLRRRMEDERQLAAQMAAKADELETTVRELRRAERALVTMNEELTQADRRKDEFLAVLAHELRNPLAPLTNAVEIMRRTRDPAMLTRARKAMARQLSHLTRLVDDLLEVSRITSGTIELRKQPVDLNEVIAQAAATSMPLIEERRHHLEVSPCPEPLAVEGDFVRLTQVISNLLNNAARYTDPGGAIEVHGRREGESAIVQVVDNGRGIEPDALAHIFEPFYQSCRGRGGLGLGLTLVSRLVELHRGSVKVASPGRGAGSVFEVALPLTSHAIPLPADGNEISRPHGAAPRKVVLIEDHPDILDTTRALLEQWGHEVLAASDGASGLELIARVRPALALIDIGLPDIDGYEVARRVRARGELSGVRLVALSGYGQADNRARAHAAGFDAHIVKPARAEALEQELRLANGDEDADQGTT